MYDIYLIRHTTPAVAKGICYGQTDLDVTESFFEEAAGIREVLPQGFAAVYSSPLQRCARLAGHLFPGHAVALRPELMELHCGSWEMQPWDELPKDEIDPWMADFVNIRVPGGESYLDLHQRVTGCFTAIAGAGAGGPVAIVAHGGVLRSILAGISGTPLIDSFKAFSLYYGCVVRLQPAADSFTYEILLNRQPSEREQHKPSTYYKKFT
ncbi:MAG TPA: alpha-ribazole phosphatase [Puia sp.]|nr:alpha-ribazole phosphatase [Puia sp.]